MALEKFNLKSNVVILGGYVRNYKAGKADKTNWCNGTLENVIYNDTKDKPSKLFMRFKAFGNIAKDMSDISVGDVLRALEGNLEPVECAAFSGQESCEAAGGCVTKYVWQRINESMVSIN